jgi:NAD(P)-dependent dehydrogenase (short-subunit alcohol dehydrogenase family)
MDPRGASVLITGGTGGLGAAVTDEFLAGGWRVVVPWLHRRELERLEGRERLVLVEADLFDPGAVAGVAEAAGSDRAAPLTAVVNLVGGYAGGSKVHQTPVEDFERQLRLNLRPTYLVTQAAVPLLIAAGGGTIVCVSSRAAVKPFSGAAGYIAAKAAVLAFAQAVAAEYAADGVRCNAVLPSVIDTPAQRASAPDADHSKWVAPADIAAVLHFLSTDASRPISGAAVPVYGRA